MPEICMYKPVFAEGAWDDFRASKQAWADYREALSEYNLHGGSAPTPPVDAELDQPVPIGQEPHDVDYQGLSVCNLKVIQELATKIGINDGETDLVVTASMRLPSVAYGTRGLSNIKVLPNGKVVTQASLGSLKTDVQAMTDQEAEDLVDGLAPKTYKYTSDATEDPRVFGLIAEDVQTLGATKPLALGLCNYDGDDNLRGLDYARLVTVLLKQQQVLKATIATMQATITSLQSTVGGLETDMVTAQSDIGALDTITTNHAGLISDLDTRVTTLEAA